MSDTEVRSPARRDGPGTGAEVGVWIIDVDDADAYPAALAALPARERRRLTARLEPHRRLQVCAQAALRVLTAAATTGTLPLPELGRGWNGKPELAAGDVHVSLSHSGTLAAVALTTVGDVGVDIEERRTIADAPQLARSLLAPRELLQWRATRRTRRETQLLRAWTRKEAVLKALGTGLSGDLQSVSSPLDAAGPDAVPLESVPAGAGAAEDWTLHDLDGWAGYVGAVAVRAPGVSVWQRRVGIGELLAAAEELGATGAVGTAGAADTEAAGTTGAERAEAAATRPDAPTGAGFRQPPSRPPVTKPDEPRTAPADTRPRTRELWRTDDDVPPPRPRPRQLFCFAHAGGNAAHFRGWERWLPSEVEVIPMDLPGHGTRIRQAPLDQWQPLVDDLTAAVARRVEGPYALVGHSFGAILAYEVARALQIRLGPPALLIAAGRNGPTAGLSHRPIHGLPDTAFLEALRRLGGMPDSLLADDDLVRMFLPVLRTDMRLAETYAREPGPPLAGPIMAFAAAGDRLTDDAGVLAWRRETTDVCELVFTGGGHFFLDDAEFTGAVAARLRRMRP